jgi:hypothetical protein
MYVIDRAVKVDPVRQWRLPDRIFFAAGACQVLAYAAQQRYGLEGFGAYWLRPAPGFRGNHIIVHDGVTAFDYHAWSCLDALLAHTMRKARRWWPGWTFDLVRLDPSVLISEERSAEMGCRMRQPDQFLHNAMPRAEAFVKAHPRRQYAG